jgi:hypothetical protein
MKKDLVQQSEHILLTLSNLYSRFFVLSLEKEYNDPF